MLPFRWKSLRDAALFLAIAAAVNAVWYAHNPAFRLWPWHPYLLVVALIGLFYGLREGLAAAFLCNLVYAAQLSLAGYPASSLLMPPDLHQWVRFVVAGLFFGEAGEIYLRHLDGARRAAREMEREKNALSEERETLRKRVDALQERALFEDVQLAELHTEAGRWLSFDTAKIVESGLELAVKITGAEAAAVYLWDAGQGSFWRRAAAGSAGEDGNAATVSWETTPFRDIRQSPRVLTLRDTPAPGALQWVAAAPLHNNNGLFGVLLLERLPLARQTAQTFRHFTYLADLLNRSLQNAEAHKVAQEAARADAPARRDVFLQRVSEELSLARRFDTPLSLAAFKIANFKELETALGPRLNNLLDHVVQSVLRHKRAMDTFSYQGGGRYFVLMPRTTPARAEAFLDRLQGETADGRVPGDAEARFALSSAVVQPDEAVKDAADMTLRASLALDAPAEILPVN